MKKLIIIFGTLFLFLNTTKAEIALPSANVLESRLRMAGFHYFIKQTTICQTLGGKSIEPLEVIIAVQCALSTYLADPTLPSYLADNIKRTNVLLLKTILDGHPEALVEIEDCIKKYGY